MYTQVHVLYTKAYACCRELSDAAIGLKAQDVETNKVIELAKKVPFCFASAPRSAAFICAYICSF